TRPNVAPRQKAAQFFPAALDVFSFPWLMCHVQRRTRQTKAGDETMTTNDHETKLRDALRKIDPQQYQEIREAYHKATEGLQTLAQTLEFADIGIFETNDHVLIDEHL